MEAQARLQADLDDAKGQLAAATTAHSGAQDALKTDTVRMAAQVNGKVRAEFEVPRDADEAFLRPLVLADANVQRHVAGKEVKKFIVVKNKLVSIVV